MQQSPKLLDLYQSLINDISEQTKSFTILQSLANKLKRKPGELLLVFLVVISMLTSTGFLGHYFTVFIGIILGVFRTIKSQESGTSHEKNQWLTYWLVIGIIINLQFVFGGLFYFVPFYDIAKLLLVISMAYPKSNLASRIYHFTIKPKLQQDELLSKATNKQALSE